MTPGDILAPGRIETLLRDLGCGCPPEVFDQVRPRPDLCPPFMAAIVVGGRLLVAVTDRASPQLLRVGQRVRDEEGLNRFRLLVWGEGMPERPPSWLRDLPDRVHVHWVDESLLARTGLASEPAEP